MTTLVVVFGLNLVVWMALVAAAARDRSREHQIIRRYESELRS